MTAVPTTLDFDGGLPRLPVLDDRAAVAQLLAPEIATDDLEVRRHDTKYEPGVRCVAAFEVRGPGARGSPRHGAVVVTHEGVTAFLLSADPGLPGLGKALDPAVVTPRLNPLVTFPGDGASWRVEPVRYKPGTRCVVRYETTGPDGAVVLFGKLRAGGSVRQAEIMSCLEQASRSVEDAPAVPPVVAVWPDLEMVVQPAAIQELELHELASDPATPEPVLRREFRRAGAAVAALHECAVPPAAPRTLVDDLGELRTMSAAVAMADPALGRGYTEVTDLLERASGDPPAQPVTSHGALRTDQLRAGRDRLGLIDLDTLCRAEAARDLGNFLAYLDWKAVRRPELGGALDTIGAAFLEGYAGRGPLPSPRRLAVYRAASLVKIAGRRFRSLAAAEWPLVPALLDLARQLPGRST